MQETANRLRVYLTHTRDALDNYYGPRALEALRQVAEVRLNDTGRHLAGAELATAAAGCHCIVSYRQSPGEAATFAQSPDLVAFLRCAVDIRNVDIAAASTAGVLVTQATPGFIPSVAELVIGQMVDLARGVSDAAASYHRGEVPAQRGRGEGFASEVGTGGARHDRFIVQPGPRVTADSRRRRYRFRPAASPAARVRAGHPPPWRKDRRPARASPAPAQAAPDTARSRHSR